MGRGDHTSLLRQSSELETDQARPTANAPAALDASKGGDGTIDPGWRNVLVGYFAILEEWSKRLVEMSRDVSLVEPRRPSARSHSQPRSRKLT